MAILADEQAFPVDDVRYLVCLQPPVAPGKDVDYGFLNFHIGMLSSQLCHR